jgi:hypothetical protein
VVNCSCLVTFLSCNSVVNCALFCGELFCVRVFLRFWVNISFCKFSLINLWFIALSFCLVNCFQKSPRFIWKSDFINHWGKLSVINCLIFVELFECKFSDLFYINSSLISSLEMFSWNIIGFSPSKVTCILILLHWHDNLQ